MAKPSRIPRQQKYKRKEALNRPKARRAAAYREDLLAQKLHQAGLRATRQRLNLARLLFNGMSRHITAESLHVEAKRAGYEMSLATIYNSLHQFTQAGLLRQVAVDSNRTYFDTNVSAHHHFFIASENRLIDIDECEIKLSDLPHIPDDMAVSGVDVIIRLDKRPQKG